VPCRIAKQLRRDGLPINAKRILRLMRADNLLSLRIKPFIPPTTTTGTLSPLSLI
jgi:hypothetical protein